MGEKGLTRSLEGAGMHAEVTCNTQIQPHVNTRLSHTRKTKSILFASGQKEGVRFWEIKKIKCLLRQKDRD